MMERLAGLASFNLYAVDEKSDVSPWWEVDVQAVVDDLFIHESDLAADVTSISVQIMHWGRLEAQAKRVWEIAQRHYRMWQGHQIVTMATPPIGDKNWKKPAEHTMEATYRCHAQYAALQRDIERAEEAYNCARYVREAFLAKRDMLRGAVMRAHDNSAPRLAV